MKRCLVGALLLLLSCVVFAACGNSPSQSSSSSSTGSSSTSQKASSQSSTSDMQSSSAGPQTVNIVEGDMSIKSDVTSFKVGMPYHFMVKNEGKVVHEFTIAKKVPGGNQDSRDAASVKDVDNIEPGQTSMFDFTLGFYAQNPANFDFG